MAAAKAMVVSSLPKSLSTRSSRLFSQGDKRHEIWLSIKGCRKSDSSFHSSFSSPSLKKCTKISLKSSMLRNSINHESTWRVKAKGFGKEADAALKTTIEMDKFIDKLLYADSTKLVKLVAENVLAFDQSFWLRLAVRVDASRSKDDKKDLEELATQVMGIVDRLVKKTEEKMDNASDFLAELLKDLSNEDKEIEWPPKDGSALPLLKKSIDEQDRDGKLDENFLSGLTAQLRKAKEENERPGLIALLQKVLQFYASAFLSRRSYSVKANGEIDEAEKLLEDVIYAESEDWDRIIYSGLSLGGGSVDEKTFLSKIELRMERVLMRTEGGSYKQRVLGEYLKEIQNKSNVIVEAFNNSNNK